MMFIKSAPNSFGFVNPRDIEDLWIQQFDWVYREYEYAVFAMTIHPDVSGRPQVLLMLERVFDYIDRHSGVRWCTFDEIADDFSSSATRAKARRGRNRCSPDRGSSPRTGSETGRAAMCSLCGVLGGRGHWTESSSSPEAFASRQGGDNPAARAPGADPPRQPASCSITA